MVGGGTDRKESPEPGDDGSRSWEERDKDLNIWRDRRSSSGKVSTGPAPSRHHSQLGSLMQMQRFLWSHTPRTFRPTLHQNECISGPHAVTAHLVWFSTVQVSFSFKIIIISTNTISLIVHFNVGPCNTNKKRISIGSG